MFKVLIGIIVGLFLFQNCGGNAKFSQDVGASAVGLNGELSGDEDDDIEVINKSCATLPQQKAVINISFPKPAQTCEWNVNGNLAPVDRFFQARIEQVRNLNLPVGAVICDAEFDFVQQDFLYDDHFMLLFNKSVIASSYDFSERFEKKNFGLLSYNWGQMAGMDWENSKEQIFCPQIPGAGSTCSFPGHDQQGFINLDYDKKYIRGIMSTGIPTNHNFTMVSIGDNDTMDCEHSDVEFDVSVTYVQTE